MNQSHYIKANKYRTQLSGRWVKRVEIGKTKTWKKNQPNGRWNGGGEGRDVFADSEFQLATVPFKKMCGTNTKESDSGQLTRLLRPIIRSYSFRSEFAKYWSEEQVVLKTIGT